jgi:large subunit ribosomal protein L23
MALFDFLKKKKRAMPKRAQDKASKDEGGRKEQGADKKKAAKPTQHLKQSRNAWRILREPHVTEKATMLTGFNQYVFKVLGSPTKPEVAKAIGEVYNVNVKEVKKITVPGKKRRRGRHFGWKSGYTKVIVKLSEGEKIEVLPH